MQFKKITGFSLIVALVVITCLCLTIKTVSQIGVSSLNANTIQTESKLPTQPIDEYEVDDIKKPGYFSIFKFIFNFIPSKAKQNTK